MRSSRRDRVKTCLRTCFKTTKSQVPCISAQEIHIFTLAAQKLQIPQPILASLHVMLHSSMTADFPRDGTLCRLHCILLHANLHPRSLGRSRSAARTASETCTRFASRQACSYKTRAPNIISCILACCNVLPLFCLCCRRHPDRRC